MGTTRSRKTLSRRDFLGRVGSAVSLGAAGMLFPWLTSRAQTASGRTKLLLLYTPHGTIWDRWRPVGGETSFTLPYILEPLERHRDQVVVVDGLAIDSPYEKRVPHTFDMPALFTGSPIDTNSTLFFRGDHDVNYGWNTGPSIDQAIANAISPATPHRTIELGVQCANSHPAFRMIYSGPDQPRQPIDRPNRAWDQIFRDAVSPQEDLSSNRRRAVLDAVREDLQHVRPTLSSADQIRIDAHTTALSELEAQLASFSGTCDLPDDPNSNNSLETDIDLQLDLIVAAFACGQTRIASMQITKADNDGAVYPWVGISTAGHHGLSHDSSAQASELRADLYRWYTERVARLCDRMAAIPDGDGVSLLDNTLILWGSEIGVGWTHDIQNIPFIVAGGRAQGVRGGRYLTPTGGRHNRLLVSAAHFMGLTNMQSFGSMDNEVGPLARLLG